MVHRAHHSVVDGNAIFHRISPDFYDKRWTAQTIKHPMEMLTCYDLIGPGRCSIVPYATKIEIMVCKWIQYHSTWWRLFSRKYLKLPRVKTIGICMLILSWIRFLIRVKQISFKQSYFFESATQSTWKESCFATKYVGMLIQH